MPISFDGKDWDFVSLVAHIKATKPEIENVEGFVKALEDKQTASLAMATIGTMKEWGIEISTATADFFQKDGDNFAEFFLLNGEENLKQWQVLPETIPRFIESFKDRPFISEPALAHFGADDMNIAEVITEQENHRVGNIVEVKFNPRSVTASAIVKFDNSSAGEKVWNDIQKGQAIYVSPAIAGFSVEKPNGTQLYTDWYGLHLARVGQPAYGVHVASIKKTCSGEEQNCIRDLISVASANCGTSFKCPFENSSTMQTTSTDVGTAQGEKITGAISTKEKQIPASVSSKATAGEETEDEELKRLRADNASLTSKLATAQEGMETVTDDVAELKKQVAEKEEAEKQAIVQEIIAIKQELGTDAPVEEEVVKEETEALGSLPVKALASMRDTLLTTKDNVVQALASVGQSTRVIQTPAIASADSGNEVVDVRSSIQELGA